MTLELLCGVLQGEVGFPIVDRTGLVGQYDLRLAWTPDERQPNAMVTGDVVEDASMFSDLQEQLGLKLERKKAMVRVMVLDGARKP